MAGVFVEQLSGGEVEGDVVEGCGIPVEDMSAEVPEEAETVVGGE